MGIYFWLGDSFFYSNFSLLGWMLMLIESFWRCITPSVINNCLYTFRITVVPLSSLSSRNLCVLANILLDGDALCPAILSSPVNLSSRHRCWKLAVPHYGVSPFLDGPDAIVGGHKGPVKNRKRIKRFKTSAFIRILILSRYALIEKKDW